MEEDKHVKATHTILESTSGCAKSLEMGETQVPTQKELTDQLNLVGLERKEKVWIYNISPQAYILENSVVKRLEVPACTTEEYVVATALPSVMAQPYTLPEYDDQKFILMDGKRVAMDLISPDNLGLDQDAEISRPLSFGNNFSKKGVFFSVHNPPLKKEIKAAKDRLKRHYASVVEKAQVALILSAQQLEIDKVELEAAVEYLKK